MSTNAAIVDAVEESINHWERMLVWMKNLERTIRKYAEPHPLMMQNDLGEAWGSKDCPLCTLFAAAYASDSNCSSCPLYKAYGSCKLGASGPKGKNAYTSVDASRTWKDAIRCAKKMLKQLKSLRNDYKR